MADEPEQTSAPPVAKAPMNWPKATLWMMIVFVIALNAALFLKTCRDLPGDVADKTGKVIEKTGTALATVAAAFNRMAGELEARDAARGLGHLPADLGCVGERGHGNGVGSYFSRTLGLTSGRSGSVLEK